MRCRSIVRRLCETFGWADRLSVSICSRYTVIAFLLLGAAIHSGGHVAFAADAPMPANPDPGKPVEVLKPNPKSTPNESTAEAVPAQSVERLTDRVRKSVVVITYSGRSGKRRGLGTGFVVSADGLIATNLHVIGEARPISVRTHDGTKYDVVKVYATERLMDLALIRIDAKNMTPLEFGDSDSLEQGQPVIAIGNPQGLKNSVVTGVVSGRREIDGKPMIQLAIPIEQGNSGGPLLDMQGRVQGILTLKSVVTDNLGFAVAINALRPLLDKPNPIPMSRWLTIGALDRREWTPLFGARWRQRAGHILVDGRGRGFGGRTLSLAMQDQPEIPYEVAVSVKLDAEDGAAGLAFFSDGNDRHYGFYPSNGRLRMSRFDGPDVYSWNVLKDVRTPAYRPGEWNHLKVRIETERIQCFINDELVIESNDSRYRKGRVGLAKFRDTKAEFKGFRIAKEIPLSRPPQDVAERIEVLVAEISTTRPPDKALIEQLVPQADAGSTVLRERARKLERQAVRLRQLAKAVHQTGVRAKLVKLLEAKEDRVDLLRAALLIAQVDNEELDVDSYIRQVDRMATEIRDSLPENAEAKTRLESLNRYLFEENGFHGSRNDYYNKSNSYLNEVIDDREGLPITLSVLYMGLAARLDLPMVGVGLPGHFVVRYEPPEGRRRLLDPFDSARELTEEQAKTRVKEISRQTLTEEHLQAQSKKAILLRMLNNLLGVSQKTNDGETILGYVDTMVAIDPEAARFRWYRAVLRYQTDRIDDAIADTEWILSREPAEIDLPRVRQLRQILEEARR